jgi:hypothetical protein
MVVAVLRRRDKCRRVGVVATLARLGSCMLALALATSCILIETQPPRYHFGVDNGTDMDLQITITDVPDSLDETYTQTARAGVLFHMSWEASLGECYGSGVVVTDPDGHHMARLEQPICRNDVWVFEADKRVHLQQASR